MNQTANFSPRVFPEENTVTAVFGHVTFGMGLATYIFATVVAIWCCRAIGKRLCYLFIYIGALIFADFAHLAWTFDLAYSVGQENSLESSKLQLFENFGCFLFKIFDCLTHTLPFHVSAVLCFDLSGIYTHSQLSGQYFRPLMSLLFIGFVAFIINCQYLLSVQYLDDFDGYCTYQRQAAFIRIVAIGVFYQLIPFVALIFLHIFRYFPKQNNLRSLGSVTLALTIIRWSFWFPFWLVSLKTEAQLNVKELERKIVTSLDQIGLIINGILISILIFRIREINLPPPLPRTSKEEKELLALGILEIRKNFGVEDKSASETEASSESEPIPFLDCAEVPIKGILKPTESIVSEDVEKKEPESSKSRKSSL